MVMRSVSANTKLTRIRYIGIMTATFTRKKILERLGSNTEIVMQFTTNTFKTSVLHYLSDYSFVYDSIRWYSTLPPEFRTDYFDTVVSVCSPHAGDSLSIAPQYVSFKRVAKVLINSSSEKFIRSDSELFGLSCLINLVQLCQFRLSTLVHLANDKVFSDSFYKACSDNPDLFLTHYIT